MRCGGAVGKPGPVADDHFSPRGVSAALQHPIRRSRTRAASRVASHPFRHSGLASRGVCNAAFLTVGPVGAYSTISPLPPDRSPAAVYFLLYCPYPPATGDGWICQPRCPVKPGLSSITPHAGLKNRDRLTARRESRQAHSSARRERQRRYFLMKEPGQNSGENRASGSASVMTRTATWKS